MQGINKNWLKKNWMKYMKYIKMVFQVTKFLQ